MTSRIEVSHRDKHTTRITHGDAVSPSNHEYISLYNQHHGVVCTGQGPWEIPDSTRALHQALSDRGIEVWVDYWGYDVAHDWDWWFKQVQYFVPQLLEAEGR